MTQSMPQLFLLPSEQHAWEGRRKLSEHELFWRREKLFWVLAAVFWGSMAMLNILGTTRFLDFSMNIGGVYLPFQLAVGVLPYPITFLCTDLISEVYGKRRASTVVWIGLLINIWILFVLWLGGALPGSEGKVFFGVRAMALPVIAASMTAYLAAQLIDVHLFHFWKNLTKGKHLWLRNNGSTIVSQLVDTILVIVLTYWLVDLPIAEGYTVNEQIMVYVVSGYVFKLVTALIDTGPFYLATHWLVRYLRLPPVHD